MNEIKRKVERFIRNFLKQQLPGERFVSAKGGDDGEDGTDGTNGTDRTYGDASLIPPYTVIEAVGAEKMIQGEPTWLLNVTVTYVTHIDDTSAPVHSRNTRAIYDQLEQLPRGMDPVQGLIVHGADIVGTDEISDAERQSHGDVISMTVGATG